MPAAEKSLAITGMSVILLATALSFVLAERWLPLLDDVHWTVSSLIAWRLAHIGQRRAESESYPSRLWFSRGLGCYAIGQLLWNGQEALAWNPLTSPADIFYWLLGPCFTIGLIKAMHQRLTPARLNAVKLDTASITLALLGFILVLYLANATYSNALEMAVLVAYPLGLLSAASVSILIIPFLGLRPTPAVVLLICGLLVLGYSWMEWNLLVLRGQTHPGSILNTLFSWATLLLGLAAGYWRTESVTSPEHIKFCRRCQQFIPLASLLITSLTVILIIIDNIKLPAAHYAALITTVFILLLGTLRQSLLLSESERTLESERMIEESQKRYEHLAYHDPLTGLPNRLLLEDRLAHALAHARRNNSSLALMFIDLDRFKDVNDSFGHVHGDELLIEIAVRLSKRVRAGDTLARLGGDEFVLLIESLVNETEAAGIAQSVIDIISQPVLIGGKYEVAVGASIGISIYPGDATDTVRLVRNADSAMYRAKELGGGSHQFYTQELTRQARERLTLEAKLRAALKNREFVLYYQPIYSRIENSTDLPITGVEALVRWQTTDGETITPDQFIPCAESNGLIVAIGEWVITEACKQLAAWDKTIPEPLNLSINLSPKQFHDSNLLPTIDKAITGSGIDPTRLTFEITESALSSNHMNVMATLETLRAMGVSVALDDFGTGQSSLSRLRQLPFDELKIDKAFIREIPNNATDMQIAESILNLAKILNLQVVAEGIENGAQLNFMHRLGCNRFQGFWLSQPLPADHIPGLISSRNASLSQCP
ncbi:MAG: GGDEF-domain containing protein [Methylobacter sp.]|nr:MAG: GGDEF-domain containing protein [Methylobacter sp.]